MVHVLRGVIVFVAIFGFLTVRAEPEEKLGSDKELDQIDNGEQVSEDQEPSLDDSVDLKEGENLLFLSGEGYRYS